MLSITRAAACQWVLVGRVMKMRRGEKFLGADWPGAAAWHDAAVVMTPQRAVRYALRVGCWQEAAAALLPGYPALPDCTARSRNLYPDEAEQVGVEVSL